MLEEQVLTRLGIVCQRVSSNFAESVADAFCNGYSLNLKSNQLGGGCDPNELTVKEEKIYFRQIFLECLKQISYSQVDLHLYCLTTLLPVLPCNLCLLRLLLCSNDLSRFSSRSFSLSNGKREIDSANSETGSCLDNVRSSKGADQLVNKLAFVLIKSDKFVSHELIEFVS